VITDSEPSIASEEA